MENVLWKIGHNLKIDTISHAEGCHLYDASGKKYIDLESGVWCTPLGHSHPDVTAAMVKQMTDISHTGYCYAHPVVQETARAVLDICGMDSGKCLFLTSGSEAVEVGVKALQLVSSKPKLMTFTDSFLGSLGSSGNRPFNEWFLFDWIACNECNRSNDCREGCDHFDQIPFDTIAGFVFEPGSSSGMVRFPPDRLVTAIAEKVHESGGFVQVNEITTGIGRTGKWFGFNHYAVTPDIVSMGKGLGNGYPVSATAFNSVMLAAMENNNFYHSQSHQNDPLGCAAALSVIRTLTKGDLIHMAREKGRHLMAALRDLAQKHPQLKEIRGRGLMIAIDFSEDLPQDKMTGLFDALLNKGYIVAKRPNLNTFRIDPPLTIDTDILDNFIRALDEILKAE